jgi:ribosomal protein L32
MGTFQVLFSGELARGATAAAVQSALAAELRIDEHKARQLFQGRTVVIRGQLSERDALELQQRLHDLGAMCRVKDVAAIGPPAGTSIDRDAARMEQKRDRTMRDITAAFVECARCGHLQLESSLCARCGVNMAAALADKRREDQQIEQQIRTLRAQRAAYVRSSPARAPDAAREAEPPLVPDEPMVPPAGPRLPLGVTRKKPRET